MAARSPGPGPGRRGARGACPVLAAGQGGAATAEDVAEVWNNCDPLATFEGDDDSQALAQKIKREAMLRIGGQR